jgi:CheY-like chemotaxis protein
MNMLPPPVSPRGHVLVVDDDAGVLNVCTALLHALGYRAASVSSGLAALETLAENDSSVELVLLDIDMPDLDGGEVLKAVKAERPEVRVLMMSGRPRDDLRGYLDQGADGVLRKPFGLSDLDDSLGLALRD